MWLGPDNDDWVELAQATGIVHSHFACGIDEAERLLTETAQQARLQLVELAERLLEPATRAPALAAVAVVANRRAQRTDSRRSADTSGPR